jgi:hypothetical protein
MVITSQTDAITSLAKRVKKLEDRIAQLEKGSEDPSKVKSADESAPPKMPAAKSK